MDIKGAQRLNREQFIYMMHVLMSRRKGRPLPIGIPLNIKELFLKEVRGGGGGGERECVEYLRGCCCPGEQTNCDIKSSGR